MLIKIQVANVWVDYILIYNVCVDRWMRYNSLTLFRYLWSNFLWKRCDRTDGKYIIRKLKYWCWWWKQDNQFIHLENQIYWLLDWILLIFLLIIPRHPPPQQTHMHTHTHSHITSPMEGSVPTIRMYYRTFTHLLLFIRNFVRNWCLSIVIHIFVMFGNLHPPTLPPSINVTCEWCWGLSTNHVLSNT